MQLRLLLREHCYNSIHDSSLIEQNFFKTGYIFVLLLLFFSFLNLGKALDFNDAFVSEKNHNMNTMWQQGHSHFPLGSLRLQGQEK